MPAIGTGLISVLSASLGAAGGMYELPKDANTRITRFAFALVVTTCVVVLSSLDLHTSTGTIAEPVAWVWTSFNIELPVVIYIICWLFGIVLSILMVLIPVISALTDKRFIHGLAIFFSAICLFSIWHCVTLEVRASPTSAPVAEEAGK